MHIPRTSTPVSATHISGVDVGLHQFYGVSWHVLMPYTLLGATLMAYSQVKLVQGQRALIVKPTKRKKNKTTKKVAGRRINLSLIKAGTTLF